jgi:hypothetical protein
LEDQLRLRHPPQLWALSGVPAAADVVVLVLLLLLALLTQ